MIDRGFITIRAERFLCHIRLSELHELTVDKFRRLLRLARRYSWENEALEEDLTQALPGLIRDACRGVQEAEARLRQLRAACQKRNCSAQEQAAMERSRAEHAAAKQKHARLQKFYHILKEDK